MTRRKSKRELERDLDVLTPADEAAADPLLVCQDPATGMWHDGAGAIYEKAVVGPIAVFQRAIDRPDEIEMTDR